MIKIISAVLMTFTGPGLSTPVQAVDLNLDVSCSAISVYDRTGGSNPIIECVTPQATKNANAPISIMCTSMPRTTYAWLDWTLADKAFRVYTKSWGGMRGNGIAVVAFTTSAAITPTINVVPLGAPHEVTAALSLWPCDFEGMSSGIKVVGGFPTIKPVLLPNTTYYLNVIHRNNFNYTCNLPACDLVIEIIRP